MRFNAAENMKNNLGNININLGNINHNLGNIKNYLAGIVFNRITYIWWEEFPLTTSFVFFLLLTRRCMTDGSVANFVVRFLRGAC
jgi:hypothetical protein